MTWFESGKKVEMGYNYEAYRRVVFKEYFEKVSLLSFSISKSSFSTVDLVPPIPSHCLILHENTSHPRQMTLS
jgi:hypothetical protein